MSRAQTLGDRLTKARLDLAARRGAEVTKSAVAQAVGVTPTSVGRWEKDEKEPALAMIQLLAEVLEVDPRWLAFGGGEARTPPVRPLPAGALQPVPRPGEAAKAAGARRRGRAS